LSYTPVHFVLVILEMGSGELLAQADLELLSSQHVFQVIRITGMSHQHPARYLLLYLFIFLCSTGV
jgi:hypothetical protein